MFNKNVPDFVLGYIAFYFQKNRNEIKSVYETLMSEAALGKNPDQANSSQALIKTVFSANSVSEKNEELLSELLINSIISKGGLGAGSSVLGLVLKHIVPSLVPAIIHLPINVVLTPLRFLGIGKGKDENVGKGKTKVVNPGPSNPESLGDKPLNKISFNDIRDSIVAFASNKVVVTVFLIILSYWISTLFIYKVDKNKRDYASPFPRINGIMVSLPYLSFIVLDFSNRKLIIVRIIATYFIYKFLKFVVLVVVLLISSYVSK